MYDNKQGIEPKYSRWSNKLHDKMEHLEIFKIKLGHGKFRKYRRGFEVRVDNLDHSFYEAKKVIESSKLDLVVGQKDIALRSFVVEPK